MKNENNQHGNRGKTPWNKGVLNPYVNARGYRCFKIDGKEIREHRMVMEEKLGRKLLSTELVHHIDGDKLNNHPDNLELRDWSEHTIEHHTGATRKEYTKRTIEVMANYRWEVDRLLKENEQLKKEIEYQKIYCQKELSRKNDLYLSLEEINREMLEALKSARYELTLCMGMATEQDEKDATKHVIERVNSAIAKAEGKTLVGS